MSRPNCYECKYRSRIAGSAHSSCKHPACGNPDPMDEAMAIFASVGRTAPVIGSAAITLGIEGNAHGIRSGWFNWPYNFDPVWLKSCNGFEQK